MTTTEDQAIKDAYEPEKASARRTRVAPPAPAAAPATMAATNQ